MIINIETIDIDIIGTEIIDIIGTEIIEIIDTVSIGQYKEYSEIWSIPIDIIDIDKDSIYSSM